MAEKVYYGKLCTLVYDLDKPTPPKDEFTLIKSVIGSQKGLILEGMCGSGRFLLPILRMGYKIEGVDISIEMLNALRVKLKAENLSTTLYNRDLLTFNSLNKYDVIFVSSGSLSLIVTEEQLKKTLDNLYSLLKIDGKLLLSYINQDLQINDEDEYVLSKSFKYNGMNLLEYCQEKNNEGLQAVDYHLNYTLVGNHVQKQSERMVMTVKPYSCDYVKNMLINSGFNTPNDLSDHIDDNELSYILCKK